MVEGPGCTLNGEKIRARVRPGQAVTDVQGSALRSLGGPGLPRAAPVAAVSSEDSFWNEGFITINPPKGRNKNGVSPVLQIQLTKDVMCFFDSSVELRNSAESQQRIRLMEELDVCSPAFSLCRAEREVKRQTGRMLCDVLMDQRVLPGVGNIIKNEALFDSGLHPTVLVRQLTDEQLHHLVQVTRDFSILFYRCRKLGLAVSKHFKVYKRPDCSRCCCRVTACRLGDHSRMTYFCPRCQKEDPQQVDLGRLPARNTDVGQTSGRWDPLADGVARRSEESWACVVCTLVNKPASPACDACLAARPPDSMLQKEGSSSAPHGLVKYPCHSFGKSRAEVKLNRKTAFGTTTLVLTDFSHKTGPWERKKSQNERADGELENTPPPGTRSSGSPPPSEKRARRATQGPEAVRLDRTVWPPSFSPAPEELRMTHHSLPSLGRHSPGLPHREPRVQTTVSPAAPGCRCPRHGRPCVLRVVSKDGENKGRRFYACALPRDTRCGFFAWADLSFPVCEHGRRSVLRTVLKTGPNQGKTFFTCPLGKEKQCGFFQWAGSQPAANAAPAANAPSL